MQTHKASVEGKRHASTRAAPDADGQAEATSNEVGPVTARPADSAPDGHTIADEQRARSDIIDQMGVETYKNDVMDDRSHEEQKAERQVPGVAPPTKRE